MTDKGRISSINNGMAVVIPSWTDEAVTCPLKIPPRLKGILHVDTNVVYTMFDDVSGEIIEVIDDYEDTSLRALDAHIDDKNNPHAVSKEDIGLGAVDNTSDMDKPVSKQQQEALNDKASANHTHKKIDNDLEVIGTVTANDIIVDDPELEALWSQIIPRGGALKLSSLLLNIAHPVGSIIQTTKTQAQFDPNTMLGGTWRLLKGVFLYGTESDGAITNNEKDGGSKDAIVVSHTHAQAAHTHSVGTQSANHTHAISIGAGGAHTHQLGRNQNTVAKGSNYDKPHNASATSDRGYTCTSAGSHTHSASSGANSASHTHSVTGGATTTGETGETGSGKNMPPYKNVNIWERTA